MAEVLISPGVLTRENDSSFVQKRPITVGAAIIGPTDVVGCTSSHGWCGPCSTPSSSHPIRITVTANLAPSAGGGTAVGVVQFTL